MELVFQVAKVNKPLLSVSKLTDGDMRVVFDKGGSYLYNTKTDDIVRIKRERGVFVLSRSHSAKCTNATCCQAPQRGHWHRV